MPIYEYACDACGHHLEIMQSIKDAPLTQCPKCKKKKLQKLVSAAGFQLKGTGWYVTDFRDKGKPATKDTEKEKKDESAGDSKSEAKTETADKPAKAEKSEKKKKKKAAD